MELTTRGRYAVMAMADLARHQAGEPVALAAIAERQKLSLAYLEQLFARLRRAEIVISARGRSGGYRLGRSAADITIADILRAVEEETRMTRCSGEGEAGCLGATRCITHGLWQALGQHIEQFFQTVTLQDVIDGGPRAAGVAETGQERLAAE
ncbi:MAG: Rrf2 family transcriptional regulator [Hyphomicrobium sp.]|jgi:iron-sulfur cluster assembly transcription factor IscR|nr:Rrf2 family transcriptional regulator [Hyphomicrobium sp.]